MFQHLTKQDKIDFSPYFNAKILKKIVVQNIFNIKFCALFDSRHYPSRRYDKHGNYVTSRLFGQPIATFLIVESATLAGIAGYIAGSQEGS